MSFALFKVPTIELIESSFVDAVIRKEIPAPVYENWRRRGKAAQRTFTFAVTQSDADQIVGVGWAG